MERSRHFEGLLILIVVLGLGALAIWQNMQPSITVSIPAASPTAPGSAPALRQATLQAQLAQAATPLPTVDPADTPFQAPTLAPTEASEEVIVAPDEIRHVPPTLTPAPTVIVLETQPGPTAYPSPTGVFEVVDASANFQPPPEEAPLRLHVNDHYWFRRPVDASANSASLFYYPFGSNGPANEWRVHHGVDMPNPIGEPIQAAASGTVIFAGRADAIAQARGLGLYMSYGNVVVIQHDEGYAGQPIWTLYAHMEAVIAEEGQHVEQGEIIGLIGGTGDVSGPHVHVEVRMGENDYYHVYNPLLWIVPYLGHGVVAGRVTYADGTPIEDATVTLSQRGRVVQTTSTYIRAREPGQTSDWHVNSDPRWQENFVLGDVPEGEYDITVTNGSLRLSDRISVSAGTTNFITLQPEDAATPQAVDGESPDNADNSSDSD